MTGDGQVSVKSCGESCHANSRVDSREDNRVDSHVDSPVDSRIGIGSLVNSRAPVSVCSQKDGAGPARSPIGLPVDFPRGLPCTASEPSGSGGAAVARKDVPTDAFLAVDGPEGHEGVRGGCEQCKVAVQRHEERAHSVHTVPRNGSRRRSAGAGAGALERAAFTSLDANEPDGELDAASSSTEESKNFHEQGVDQDQACNPCNGKVNDKVKVKVRSRPVIPVPVIPVHGNNGGGLKEDTAPFSIFGDIDDGKFYRLIRRECVVIPPLPPSRSPLFPVAGM